MSKDLSRNEAGNVEVLALLKRYRGYQGWRIRPYPYNTAVWLAEEYTYIGRGNKKGWRALWDEKRGSYRTFASPGLAHAALIAIQKKLDEIQG